MNTEYTHCFACGPDNPDGMKLRFAYQGDEANCDFVSEPRFEGYPGIIHGGIVGTILDEAMAHALFARRITAVTMKMTTTYRRKMSSDTPYRVTAKVLTGEKRVVTCEARITDAGGNEIASATADFFRVKQEQKG